MNLNLQPMIQLIRQTDFTSASPAKARAIYGILNVLGIWVADGEELMQQLVQHQSAALQPFMDTSQQSTLTSQLSALLSFYQQDIHLQSGGDDQKAHQLLETANRTLEQCHKEAVEHCESEMEAFFLYFHVLCLAHPGYRHPDNVRLYHNYARFFNALPVEDLDPDSDLAWQYREVRWCYDMLHEQHFDRSLLSGLTFMESEAAEAFRIQCYKWMLFIDPDYDGSVQELKQNNIFLTECLHRIYAWLHAKYENHISINAEKETSALLSLYCGINAAINTFPSLDEMETKAYTLLDRLPNSKLKTHLMAQVALNNQDPDLMEAAYTDISTWDKSLLTQEDKYLTSHIASITHNP